MPFALGIVTVLALLMTIGMGIVTWRLVREERRRSAARLSALAAELTRQDTSKRPPVPTAPSTTPIPTVDTRLQPSTSRGGTGEPVAAFSLSSIDLFQTRSEGTEDWKRRLAGFGVAGVVFVTIVSVAVLTFPDGRQTSQALEEHQVPVELLALTHEHQDGILAISGTVRNPGNGQAERYLTVMALALDGEGIVVATGRAPLEREILAAGAESSFAVSLPVQDATRYRISFLFEDTTVPHLDRRVPPADAAWQTES